MTIMSNKYMIAVLTVMMSLSLSAQTFSPAFQGWSKKKQTYITMKDGTEHTVNIKKLKFKKGLIDELKVVPVDGGKKIKIKPENISHMYIAPSNLAKLGQTLEASTDLTRIQDGELDSGHLQNGYMYMESSEVQIKKKKTQYCMLQVMNPTFSGKIKVYNDPFAKKSAGIGIGDFTIAGGLDKSYYIKKEGEQIARKIKKKDYKKDIETLFSECPTVVDKYKDNPQWSEFEQFIYDYSITCN